MNGRSYSAHEIIYVISRKYGINAELLKTSLVDSETTIIKKYTCYFLIKYCRKNTPKELADIMCINNKNNEEVIIHFYDEILKSSSVIDKVKSDISELEKYIERHFLSLAKIEGFTIQDAIDNPVILKQFKKRGS